MKNSFVNNSDDIFSINQALTQKIEFLSREKVKTDTYIKDLEESLRYNKEAVRTLNSEGPNNATIRSLNQQNEFLHNKLQQLYAQNRDINALRLFQAQIRIQDKSFYNQRVLEFESRISDLRKYLHDKEDSFTNVVNRLRKYQDIGQVTIEQKLSGLKNQLHQNMNHDIIAGISRQRNMFKKLYQDVKPTLIQLQILQRALKNKYDYEQFINIYTKQATDPKDAVLKNQLKSLAKIKQKDQITKATNTTNQIQLKFSNPNRQLIRLLKKQKLSNQILQETLNDAIEKNEQLLNNNQIISQANRRLEQRCQELSSQILVLEGYLSEFDDNYRRKNIKLYSKCDADKPNYQYSQFSQNIHRKDFMKKLKNDVDKISSFMTSTKNKIVNKSCSNPRLIIKHQIDDDDFQIEQI